jgi:predicted ArsR family transcriptional regulator
LWHGALDEGGILSGLTRRFLDSTRGQILGILRKAPTTVEDLAGSLGLTDNAIRSHLSTLERDGLVRQSGVRRGPGAGKPATIYEVPIDAEPLFSRAYVPVLEALLDELAANLPSDEQESIMRNVGHRIASSIPRQTFDNLDARAEAAAAVLNSLGGDAQVERSEKGLSIRGCGCPLSVATSKRPAVCKAVETLLTDVMGVPVHESCDRGARPQCCFQVDVPAA